MLLQTFFESNKQRAKVTEEEEKKGKQIFLKREFGGGKATKKAKQDLESQRRLGRKAYKTDFEGGAGEEDSEEEVKDGLTNVKKEDDFEIIQEERRLKKHFQVKQEYNSYLQSVEKFQEMKYFLDCGFNLLVYGIGSKRNLLNSFMTNQLDGQPCLVINGFHSATSIKSITSQMIKFVKDQIINIKCGNSANDQIEEIKRAFDIAEARNDNDFHKYYVLIHSMDMGQLKNEEWQNMISELAQCRKIGFIISMDHIKSSILWSDSMLDRLNFYAYELNTFEDFDVELEFQTHMFTFKNDN